MPADKGARQDVRQRRAIARLSASGSLGGATLASPSGLQLVSSALSIDIGQSPSILAIDSTGLITQFVVASGTASNESVTITANGTGTLVLQTGSTHKGIEISDTGSAAKLGFYATTPIAQQTADRTTASILAKLAATGLILDSGSKGVPQVDTYTSTGANTWTKPSGAVFILAILIGGGGGGGGGRRGAAGTARLGGSGGGGGALTIWSGLASDLGATETVTVGAKGTGGAAAGADNTDGGTPTAGSNTTLGSVAKAEGGYAGAAGSATVPTPNASAYLAAAGSTPGGVGSFTVGGVAGASTCLSSGAGGGGGGGSSIGVTNVANNGSAGGKAGGNGLAGGTYTAGSAGGAGNNATTNGYPGSGGGGGDTGKNGGAGGWPGGGGGGGGAILNGTASGAGGDGADGIAVVITFFS